VPVAFELYAMAALAGPAPRCRIARARILRSRGDDAEAEAALDAAESAAGDDADIEAFVAAERRRS
jgi:hypothetical protein